MVEHQTFCPKQGRKAAGREGRARGAEKGRARGRKGRAHEVEKDVRAEAKKGMRAARYSPDSSEEDTPSPGWTLEESISRKAGLEVTRTLMRTSRPSLWSR